MGAAFCAMAFLGCVQVMTGAKVPAPGDIVVQNRLMQLRIDTSGRAVGVIDRKTGANHAGQPARPFVVIRTAGRTLEPVSASRAGDTIHFAFSEPGVGVDLRVESRARYLVVELTGVHGAAVDDVDFCALRFGASKYVSDMSGLVSDGQFACAMRVLDPVVAFRFEYGAAPSMVASWSPMTGRKSGEAPASPTNVRVALVGCPAGEARSALQEIVRSGKLPYSPLGGPFALDAPENRGSYVFAFGIGEKNVDKWAALCRRAGIAEAHMCEWQASLGHYQPRKEDFPTGVAGLKVVVGKLHAAGLKVGMHTLTASISTNDSYLTPVPDRRLSTDATYHLAAPIGPADTEIRTAEAPHDLDTIFAYGSRGNVLWIDDELIFYSAYTEAAPTGFQKCTRGAFGTKPQAHAAGAPVRHLRMYAGCFYPDENTDLPDEIAQNIANVFNTCGFDMIYMDGAEGTPGGWHGVYRMRAAIFSRIKRRVLVSASEWGYHSWPFHSRIGAWDYPNWGLKQFVDIHCRSNEDCRNAALLPAELGWWSIFGASEDRYGQRPDEVEYLFCKSLAFDMPMSFQGIGIGQPENMRQDEYLDMLGRYERLRLGKRVLASVRKRLQEAGQDFHMIAKPDGSADFVPTDYLSHRVESAGGASVAWSVQNRYGAQPLRLRIQALHSAAPYGGAEGVLLTGLRTGVSPLGCSVGMTASLAPALETPPSGSEPGMALGVRGTGGVGAWVCAKVAFAQPRDLSRYGAMGVWILGDGKGEVLNFQLTNPIQYWPTYDEHYVTLDFTGWRYVEMHLRERDAAAYDSLHWPYGDTYSVHRNPLIRGAVSGIAVYMNAVPAGGEARCVIGPVRMLPVASVKLANPRVTLNGQTLTLPVTLASGQYIEMDSASDCRVYSEVGKLIERIVPSGTVPQARAGANEVAFACDGPDGYRARAMVTVVTSGEPLR